MDKLKGHGRPHNHTIGEVGQHYEDLDTGDLYECRIARQYSPTHGWPVGGYVWELRAKGEDIQELYGSGGGSQYMDKLKIAIGTNSEYSLFEHDPSWNKVFVYDNTTARWEAVSINGLYEKLKPLGSDPHVTLDWVQYEMHDNEIGLVEDVSCCESARVWWCNTYEEDGFTQFSIRITGIAADLDFYEPASTPHLLTIWCDGVLDREEYGEFRELSIRYLGEDGKWAWYDPVEPN